MEPVLDRITREINELRRKDHTRQVENALAIGQRLSEAQRILKYGEWSRWRKTQVHLSARTAANLLALSRFHASQPDSFKQLSRLGLDKLYRVAELPARFHKRLKPGTRLRLPGTDAKKSMEEMNPIELNRCVQRLTHRAVQRRPNQMARVAVRDAERLHDVIEKLVPRLNHVRPELLQAVRERLTEVAAGCKECLGAISRAVPAA